PQPPPPKAPPPKTPPAGKAPPAIVAVTALLPRTVGPPGVAIERRPTSRAVLLPAAAVVVIDVAVDVRILVAVHRCARPAVGLAGVRIGRRTSAHVRVTH